MKILLIFLCILMISLPAIAAKPRTVVTTDGEVDDIDSFIRMLLYTNEFDVVGLVYSSSMWHYKGDGQDTPFISEMDMTREMYGERTHLRWVGTQWIQELLDLYAQVYPNLLQHDPEYPAPDDLREVIRIGNIDFEGAMARETEGSEFIKALLLDGSDDSPIYLQAWGGTNTIARALKSIEEEFRHTPDWQHVYKRVSDKTVIYIILDQDSTYKRYIEPNWPSIRVLYNSRQFLPFAYLWPETVPEGPRATLEGTFFAEHILNGHGPLMAHYYTWGDDRPLDGDPEHNRATREQAREAGRQRFDFISEGDSPAFIHLIDVGLGTIENPHFGGWPGRLIQSSANPRLWRDGEDVTDLNTYTGKQDKYFPITRWVEAMQRDFAARADWNVLPFEDANHPPVVSVSRPNHLYVAPGSSITLHANASDPDGDPVTFSWWEYAEAGNHEGTVNIDADGRSATVSLPSNATAGQTVHIIVEGTDQGTPPLTRYQRVVLEIAD